MIGESIDDELKQEVEFFSVPVNKLTSWTKNRSFAENCGRVAQQRKFDIVYGLGRSFGLDAVRVTERLQAHWVNVYYKSPLNRCLQRLNPRHRTLIELEQSIYQSNQVRRIVVQSELDQQLLKQYYQIPAEKISIVYNGVDTQLFNPQVQAERLQVRQELNVDPDAPLLLFASMDFEGKGLRFILQALKETKNQDTQLLILGTGPIRKFRRYAKWLGIERNICFAGRQTNIQRYYGTSDLFLLPTAYEPFPNVNLEAMACGLPVLTTQTSGGADIVEPEKNGYLISEMNAVDEMTKFINHHCSLSQETLQKMSNHCWQLAKQMTVEKNVLQTLSIFNEVLDEKVSL